ncbi:T9SS type A sorting domain-containing protein [Aestuariivivens sediminicola]|uniref:T9SS type A sorting domain-containing protein n=1 Tax=Aestuariivivens sediminicola TaxID=2913560 RepID=UPI001F58DFB8|nr:T9SS type A sorting domain-containing protein [Aestuariivivens sediminicola]
MKKFTITFLLCPFLIFSQIQIGDDIVGDVAQQRLGTSVSISSDGNIVAISAPEVNSNVRIYENISNTWTQIGSEIAGDEDYASFGYSLSLSSDGTIIAIGKPYDDTNGSNVGKVKIYENIGGTWTQIGSDLTGDSEGQAFGTDISLSADGSTIAVSTGYNSPYVRIFENVAGVWTQIGLDIILPTETYYRNIPISLSSDGSTLVVGDATNYIESDDGEVKVFKNIAGTWTQIGNTISFPGDFYFGTDVSISSAGNIIACGSLFGPNVKVFENIGGVWTQVGLDIEGTGSGNGIGYNIELSSDGSIIAISENYSSFFTSYNSVYVFRNISGQWVQQGTKIDGVTDSDEFGAGLAISADGSILAIGGPGNDNNGAGSGHVQVYDFSAVLSSDDIVLQQFSIFPNPTKDYINIQLKEGVDLKKISVYNNVGQFIYATRQTLISTKSLSKGLYFIEVETDSGKATKRIIIE